MNGNLGGKVRLINSELNQLETLYQRQTMVSQPPIIHIPTGSMCNLRCVFCTERSAKTRNYYAHLSFSEFLSLSEGLAFASMVSLYGWGEPLLNPEYRNIFDYVTDYFPGIEINISTNGTMLSTEWLDKLLGYGNFFLNVSVNAATRKTYAAIAKQDLFETVIGNLKSLRDMRRKFRGNGKNRVSLSFVVIRDNLRELPDFVDLAADLAADHVQFMDLLSLNKRSQGLSIASCPEKAERYMDEAVRRASHAGISIASILTYSSSDYISVPKRVAGKQEERLSRDSNSFHECYAPWKNLLLNSNGDAYVCCRSNSKMGNIREEGVSTVWNGRMYQYFRSAVNTETPPDDCLQCPVRSGLSSKAIGINVS